VKFKKLVGGGSMQIVNQTVPRALRSLGYQEEQVEAIVEHIAQHGNVVDAPGLRPSTTRSSTARWGSGPSPRWATSR
jgi:ribonucleoside-diphosphate reductase alpha chain